MEAFSWIPNVKQIDTEVTITWFYGAIFANLGGRNKSTVCYESLSSHAY